MAVKCELILKWDESTAIIHLIQLDNCILRRLPDNRRHEQSHVHAFFNA